MTSWQPNNDGLTQILQLLRDSHSPNPTVQQNLHQVLNNET